MKTDKKNIVVGISGASGANLAVLLLSYMKKQPDWETHLVYSNGAKLTLLHETTLSVDELEALADHVHDISNVGASIASGTFKTAGMVIVPCSMKTLAGVANGFSDNLMLRAADVSLKERRKLILVTRETPLHIGHMKNMITAASLGAVILPPMMTHYIKPGSIIEMENHIVGKILNEFGIEFSEYRRWEGI